MKPNLSPLLLLLILLCATPQAFGTDDPLSCADRSITASAVRTTEDVQAFVQCAYEFVQDVGFEEAYLAFHEDERWRSGPIYISVDEVTSMAGTAVGLVFPPDPSTERIPGYWGLLIDVFGNDWYKEQHRLMSNFGEGWMYYSFTNPETGRDEPKVSYLKSIDWDGTPASILAGGGLPPRPSRHLRERRGQRHGA